MVRRNSGRTIINTNYLALVSQNNLSKSQSALGSAIERLSSGLRINSAKDDAAGQAIANRFTAQIRGLTQAARNANDGISIAQTTEGSLNEINNNLQRIRELAVQAYNGTNSSDDIASINAEIKQRFEEIDRVANKSEFNGVFVLNGSIASGAGEGLAIQVGARDMDVIRIQGADARAVTLLDGATTITSGAGIAVNASGTVNIPTASGNAVLATIDAAIKKVDTMRSNLGAVQNRFESTIANLNNTITNLTASRSRIEDADYAVEVSNMTRAQILQQAGTAVLAQANQVPQTMLSLLR
ncbi:flagellin N-terminal helical domain-containing protein [Castellaniella defragrans]|uniref:Flagellin n=1 Tax=Castellaniella defragrans TaxID=75697 RepID=A0A7W9WPU9_CASDE|nr:flagellin [Castellaniella defragrans]KAB0622519.1 flagellin FliC [Castellaniella defragrans]MBB6084829.1 flagellin [Castellaniella defragrans]